MLPALLGLVPTVLGIIDKIIPDKQAAEKAKLEIERELTKGIMDAATAQVETNKEQAKHASIFVAGARPFIMWVAGFALAWNYAALPFIASVMAWFNLPYPTPVVPIDNVMMELIFGLLGLGAMRSYDKLKGTDTKLVNIFKGK